MELVGRAGGQWLSSFRSNLVRLRGEEITELGANRAKVELAHACFAGGCVIWKKIFAKQFAYHWDKPLDPRAEHAESCPMKIVEQHEISVLIYPNTN